MRLLYPTCVFMLIAVTATAQIPTFGSSNEQPMGGQVFSTGLQGRVLTAEGVEPTHFRLVIVDPARRNVIAEAYVTPMGFFDFANAAGGSYELRVINRDGDSVYSTIISLPQSTPLNIDLRPRKTHAARRPVSLTRLQHKVPKKAKLQFEHAARCAREQKLQEAAAALEEAIAIDPQFFEAANNLGALYVKAGLYPKAFEMFHRATTIDASDPLAEANLAFVLLKMQRFPEAEDAARASVRGDATSGRARFFLAVSLLEQHKNREEALFHLSQAKEDFEPALQLLEQLKLEEGPK
jgi:tetratricopeptide (TPR) repeat protein